MRKFIPIILILMLFIGVTVTMQAQEKPEKMYFNVEMGNKISELEYILPLNFDLYLVQLNEINLHADTTQLYGLSIDFDTAIQLDDLATTGFSFDFEYKDSLFTVEAKINAQVYPEKLIDSVGSMLNGEAEVNNGGS